MGLGWCGGWFWAKVFFLFNPPIFKFFVSIRTLGTFLSLFLSHTFLRVLDLTDLYLTSWKTHCSLEFGPQKQISYHFESVLFGSLRVGALPSSTLPNIGPYCYSPSGPSYRPFGNALPIGTRPWRLPSCDGSIPSFSSNPMSQNFPVYASPFRLYPLHSREDNHLPSSEEESTIWLIMF